MDRMMKIYSILFAIQLVAVVAVCSAAYFGQYKGDKTVQDTIDRWKIE